MKTLKNLLLLLFVFSFAIAFADDAQAQWSIGASYETRDEDPTNGFGLRVERGVLGFVPLVDFNVRAHFSFFNETNNVTRDGASYSEEIEAYDYGLALTAGVNIALVKPYIGLGLGAETFDLDIRNGNGEANSFDETNLYLNGFGGLELNLLPMVKPFIEYRLSHISGSDQIDFSNVNRLAIGLNLRF